MGTTWNELASQDYMGLELAQQWVKASRCLSQLEGYLQASALSELAVRLLCFAEALDSSRAQGSGLDMATLARDAVMRESSRSPQARDALQGLAAMQNLMALPAQASLSVPALLQVQSMLCPENPGLPTSGVPTALERWLSDWQLAAHPGAHTDALLQLPLLHTRWHQMQPLSSDHQRMGRLLDVLLLQRSGLISSMAMLWSRALMTTAQRLDWRSGTAARPGDSVLARQAYVLQVVETAAKLTLEVLSDLSALWSEVNHAVQAQHKFFSPELVRHLFVYPATRVELLAHELAVTRLTATRYLDALVGTGILQRERFGRDNVYAHAALQAVLKPKDKWPKETLTALLRPKS